MFGALQHKTFPIYFVISMALSSGLLGLWTWSHPDVIIHILRPNVADVAQAYALASVLLSQGLNYFVIGPLTSKYVTLLTHSNNVVLNFFSGSCSNVTSKRKKRVRPTMSLV